MADLNSIYARHLTIGFVVLRQAFESRDDEWINAELELLHNVSSLIDEGNALRHQYFWSEERTHYIRWASSASGEAASRMRTFYEPIWQELGEALAAFEDAA